MSAQPRVSGRAEKTRLLQVLGLIAVSRLGRARPGGSPKKRLAPKLFLGFHVIQQQLDYPFAVDGLEGLARRLAPERFQGPVDHGLVGLADPFLGKAVDGFAFREVEPELAVHVLDGPLLVGDVGVGEEHPGPDLPVPVGLDRGEVGEAGVVVGQYEGEDPFEGLPPDLPVGPVPKRPDGLGVVLGQEPDVGEVELGYGDGEDGLFVRRDGAEEVHLAPELAGVGPAVGEVIEVAPPFLPLGASAVFVGLGLPLLVPDGHGEVGLLRGRDAERHPAVDRLLRGDLGDLGVPGYLVDRLLRGEPGDDGVVDDAELGLVAVDALPALHEPSVRLGLGRPGVVAELGASAFGPAVFPRAVVAYEGEAAEAFAFPGSGGGLRPVPFDLLGNGRGVHADPLGDGPQGLVVGEPMGDLHPLLEGEMLPMW